MQSEAATGRSKALRSGVIGSVLFRGIAVASPLLLIPVMLSYIGPTYFGLWMTLVAAAAFTAFADLGLGNGLMTRLPEALARGELQAAREVVSSAYMVLASVALVAIAGVWASIAVVPWPAMLDPQGAADPGTLRLLAAIAFSAFFLNVPSALVIRIYYAHQRVAAAAVWQAAASLAPLAPVILAIEADTGPVIVVGLALASGPMVNVANTAWCFIRVHPELRPARSHVTRIATRDMFSLGGRFFTLTVALTAANNTDSLILAQVLGLTAVAAFAVPAKAFLQLGQVVSLVNLPLWAASSDALAHSDREWVQLTTRRMITVSFAAVLAFSLPLVAFGEELIRKWTGEDLAVPTALTLGFATWWLILGTLSPLFMIQNGAGIVGPQLVGWGAYAVASVPAKLLAVSTGGASLIPWVGVLLLTVTVLPSAVIGYRRAIHEVAVRQTPESIIS